jgi:hypothetical protein
MYQIPIEAYHEALKFMGIEDIDLDETQCNGVTNLFVCLTKNVWPISFYNMHYAGIIANLIFDNKIKGYISNSHNKLVISKKDAFPSLAAIV